MNKYLLGGKGQFYKANLRVTVYDQNGSFAMTRPYYPEEYTDPT